jgi:high-affinity iron transporter
LLTAVAVLLGFINQIIPPTSPKTIASSTRSSTELLSDLEQPNDYGTPLELARDSSRRNAREGTQVGENADRESMIRAMRIQIWTGAILGGLAAAAVGAIFLFVVSDTLI